MIHFFVGLLTGHLIYRYSSTFLRELDRKRWPLWFNAFCGWMNTRSEVVAMFWGGSFLVVFVVFPCFAFAVLGFYLADFLSAL